MAVLKYKAPNGEWIPITNYNIVGTNPVQETGSSTSEVMSQNAVTEALAQKVNNTDLNNTVNSLIYTELYGTTTKPTENPPTTVTTENLTDNAVISIGDKKGAITLQNNQSTNGAINLTMAGNQLQASIVGLKSNAFSDATIPTNTNQLTNGAGFITSSGSITGSSGSCTGNAATATKLGTESVGNATKPIYLVNGAPTAFTNALGSAAYTNSTDYAAASHNHDEITYNTGANTVTTLASVPITKRMVFATSTSNTSLTLANTLPAGKELHIVVVATSSDRTITLPNANSYRTMDGETSWTLKANTHGDINIVSDGTTMYIRAL